jgi:hypothetical protein
MLAVVAGFLSAFLWQVWTLHARFGTYGFDLGIFDQGTWLLSRLQSPFVTIRGLPLFGDHGSYILLLVAPLYRLWPDPRLLLTLQVVFLAIPALVVYRVGARRLGHQAAGLAVAAAYLAYPGMQWAITWQFHPETLAAGFLALAALAAVGVMPEPEALTSEPDQGCATYGNVPPNALSLALTASPSAGIFAPSSLPSTTWSEMSITSSVSRRPFG